jgi:hypothetical protein
MRLANNPDASARTVAWLRSDHDFYVLAECGKQPHQTLAGEVRKAAVEEGGNLRLVDAHESCGGDLSQAPSLDDLADMARKLGLGQLFLGLGTDDLKFALHVVFYGSATFQFRGRTDKSPMIFLHGEADNYVIPAPTREFADWAQSQGNPVTFITYPKALHDFDVLGQVSGFLKTIESSAKCDW